MAISVYKASNNKIGVKGTHEYIGKSSCTDPLWLDHAKALAKSRAVKRYESHIKSLAAEGKTWKNCKATGQCTVNGYSIRYVVKVTLE